MTEDLESAIASYTDWQKPWGFYQHVLGILTSEKGRSMFQVAWREALDERYWSEADLTERSVQAEQGLRIRFPELKASTLAAIVRAASYEWK